MSTNAMWVLTPIGRQLVADLTEWERSLVGRYWDAIRHYLETGDFSRLLDVQINLVGATGGFKVGGKRLTFDPYVIEYEAARGEARFEEIYES